MFNLNTNPTYRQPHFLIYIIFLVLAALMLFLGISGMAKENVSLDNGFTNGFTPYSCYSGVPDSGNNVEYADISNSISGIPLLHEHYYLICNKDMTSFITIRAEKGFEKHFNVDFENIDNTNIKGIVKKLPSQLQRELISKKTLATTAGVSFEEQYFIDTLSHRINTIQIIIGIGNIIIAALTAISAVQYRKASDYGGNGGTLAYYLSNILIVGCGAGIIYLALMI